jgi:hypothetical protein
LGIFDKDEFYGFVDVPKGYKAKIEDDDNLPQLRDIDSDSDDE